MLAWYRGEFETARARLEAAAVARSEEDARALEAVWFMPNEGTASIYTHLALASFMQGDLAGAEAELARTARRCEEVDFPQGAFSLAYAHQMEFLMRIAAGQLEQAAEVAADLARIGEQHGFDSWALAGAAQLATVSGLSSLVAETVDPAELLAHVSTITAFVDMWRALGVISLITFYDCVIAQLLAAAGQRAEARDRIDAALQLAEETGMHFHDAELLRIRAQTREDDSERHADLAAAVELAREQGATIHELRSAADDFEVCGEPARQPLIDAICRFPEGSTWPPLARARALLE
jgi:tetratricopeptide (TPR) repeat protein